MIIEVDEYKKQLPGYNPDNSEDFHRDSAKLADKDFEKHLKSGKYKKIIFMAGGTASGKTEFARSYLTHSDQLVYDGTLRNIEGLVVKLQKAPRNIQIEVILIIPENIEKSLSAFLSRERKMKLETFFETHIKSKITVAKILQKQIIKDFKIDVKIYASYVSEGERDIQFEMLTFDGWDDYKELLLLAKMHESYARRLGVDLSINYDIV